MRVAGRDGQLPATEVIVLEIVTRYWWHRVLHDHGAGRLRRALRDLPGVVVTSVPFHLAH